MKPKTIAILALLLLFGLSVGYAMIREFQREKALVEKSISGLVEVDPRLFQRGEADVVRTDRLVLMLVDPATRRPVVLRFESPLVPPQNIRIGLEDARDGLELQGPYLLVGITDKDGEIYKVTPGEIYGRSAEPVELGATEIRLVLDQPYRGTLFNEPARGIPSAASRNTPPAAARGSASRDYSKGSAGEPDPRYSISGTIVVSKALASRVTPRDKLIILLFDPETPRPMAFKIIPHTLLPQRFSIALPPEAQGNAKPGYFLRILTDNNDDPFGASEGEVVGRSKQPVPLGTKGLVFELDQPYTR